MIVRNEAHQLADCLIPVAELFDDIVIVDTGSHDDSRQVARRFTPKVFDFEWCDDFSAARNESLRHADGDWVFWLDADDRLTPDNFAKLRALLDGLTLQPRIFLMDVRCLARGTGEMERVVTHPRLFRRHPALAWHRRVHEQIHALPGTPEFEFVFSDVRIDHRGYRDPALTQRKLQRNIRLLRMEYAVHPDDPVTLLELGLAYARHRKTGEARRYFDRLLETAPRDRVHTRGVFAALVELAIQEGNHQEAVDLTARGLVFFPDDEYLAFLQSEALYQLGEYGAARMVLWRLINGPEPAPHMRAGAPHEIRRRLAPLGLGEVLRMERDLDLAEGVLRNVVRLFPEDPVAWHQLGRIYVDMGNWQKLEEVLDRLSACSRGDKFAPLLIAAWKVIHGELEAAEGVIDAAIAKAPEMAFPRAIRAECLKRRGAPAATQLRAYRDMLRLQPGNAHAVSMIASLEVAGRVSADQSEPCSSVVVGSWMPAGGQIQETTLTGVFKLISESGEQ